MKFLVAANPAECPLLNKTDFLEDCIRQIQRAVIPYRIAYRHEFAVVDYKNEEAFFQKLLLLYKDKNLYNQMATAAETDIKKRLSCDKMMDELEHLYNEYINK